MALDRFLPWFKLEFEQRKPPDDGFLSKIAAKLGSLVPIDRNFYEADVKIEMHYELVSNIFEVTVAGLSPAVYDSIEPNKTVVKISLGYYGGLQQLVFEGIVQKKEMKVGDCFYETVLSGVEKAWDDLNSTCIDKKAEKESAPLLGAPKKYFLDLLKDIESRSKVHLKTENTNPPNDETLVGKGFNYQKCSALYALEQIHERVRQIKGYSLFLHDGNIWYGKTSDKNTNTGTPIKNPDLYTFDNFLTEAEPIEEDEPAREGDCKPKKTDDDDKKAVGYSFEMLGDPQLRPGDTVNFQVKKEKDTKGSNPTVALTIQSITHNFSRTNGYRCTGRALISRTFLTSVFSSKEPSEHTVSEDVKELLTRDKERNPAVRVGDILHYKESNHVADTKINLDFRPTMTSPSIEANLGSDGITLQHRPIVSSFAWDHCGLVVPVYRGMRAVSIHNQYLREDALLNGFLWTEAMTPPPNKPGDYWLCLPLNVPADNGSDDNLDKAPKPSTDDKAANDLITGDGKRVIQLKGLRITVGEKSLENLGKRPSNVGSDNELQIEHSSGAKITIKDHEIDVVTNDSKTQITMSSNSIKLQAGGRTVNISGGKVSIG